MKYKRRSFIIRLVILIYTILSLFNFIGCEKSIPPIVPGPKIYSDFSVHFLNVGQGDCIFIRLPDGKNMLIDSGENDAGKENSKYIISYLNNYEVKTIDYFVLTHPDDDHIGCAIDIMNTFSIGKMFIPKIHPGIMQNFQSFENVLKVIEQKQIEYKYSMFPTKIVGTDYHFAFLSPQNDHRNSYNEIIKHLIPTSGDINNLSPIIYFSCFDKRFIFTGDAESKEEKYVVENYISGVYDLYYNDLSINLTGVDYLKLSHHGSNDASCEEFLSLLRPKNVIISVGNDNFYGHPSSDTLLRIQTICIEYNLYRTDQHGTITIYKENQEFKVQTAKE